MRNNTNGGMQSDKGSSLSCKCGKETSRKMVFTDKEITIHFTKKSTYWHIYKNGSVKRTLKKPIEWA